MVRAKFTVSEITRSMGSKSINVDGSTHYVKTEMWTIKMNPVYGNGDPNHENTKFWEASPGGQIQLSCVNKAAVEQFDIGKEFYVDFTLAE